MVYPEPRITERDFEEIVHSLIQAIERECDVEFQLAAWGYDTLTHKFAIHRNNPETMEYIQKRLDLSGRSVFTKFKALGMYLGGIFPFKLESIFHCSDAVLVKNYRGKVMQFENDPFLFRI